MMTRLQLLLAKLAEEANEVSQIVLKNQQFGLHEIWPEQKYTNAERAHYELDDLMAMVEMLNDEYGFGYVPNRERMDAKKAKVNIYADKSIRLGHVEPARKAYTAEELTDWWAAICDDCGWRGLSRDCDGGTAIADTGDYSDVLCPRCGSRDIDEDHKAERLEAQPS